ncbi:MAG: hypothetical protein HC772_20460 [Leptolyngbyaceae cyanobacterium CRU_2_3]|nr:hypothetical protein [Leptolyngbyaceae cyanobacterium CRU_2_3]
MTYFDRLHPWCIIRLLPKMQRIVVARFRYRGQAEEYLHVLRRLNPTAHHILVFDPPDRHLPDAIAAAILLSS